MSDAAYCLSLLRDRRQFVATAESLTAGLIAATFAEIPGASDVLRGGLAAYATDVKSSVLGVDPDLIRREGVVSAACAAAMATAARTLFAADWAVSATGVAGPAEQDGIPVGTVYVAVAGPEAAIGRQLALSGDRARIRSATVTEALALLREALTSLPQLPA